MFKSEVKEKLASKFNGLQADERFQRIANTFIDSIAKVKFTDHGDTSEVKPEVKVEPEVQPVQPEVKPATETKAEPEIPPVQPEVKTDAKPPVDSTVDEVLDLESQLDKTFTDSLKVDDEPAGKYAGRNNTKGRNHQRGQR